MERVSGRLTVCFEDPFWVGVFERIEDKKLSAAKVTFGAEPKDYEVLEFINRNYYYWARLGCMNYSPTFFGTSYPEVVDIKENDDGTVTLTVNAVCEMVLNDEAIITHELTIRESEDGSFMYMGNKILDDGINRIPVYQFRISISQSEKDKDRGE